MRSGLRPRSHLQRLRCTPLVGGHRPHTDEDQTQARSYSVHPTHCTYFPIRDETLPYASPKSSIFLVTRCERALSSVAFCRRRVCDCRLWSLILCMMRSVNLSDRARPTESLRVIAP